MKIKYFNFRKVNEFTLNLPKKTLLYFAEIIFLSTIEINQL